MICGDECVCVSQTVFIKTHGLLDFTHGSEFSNSGLDELQNLRDSDSSFSEPQSLHLLNWDDENISLRSSWMTE